MNLFSVFRNKYFCFPFGFLFFIISCTTSEVENSSTNRSFDYSSFNFIKSSNIIQTLNLKSLINAKTSTLQRNQQILDQINLELGTNVSIPNLGLKLTDFSGEEIIEIGIANQWIDDVDVQLIDNFMTDIENYDFDYAITNFENTVLSLDISNEKFQKLTTFANILESVNFQHPTIFINDSVSKKEAGGWACALATLALASATAGLATCATVVACSAAIALHVAAVQNFARECLSQLEPSQPEVITGQ